MRKWFVLFHRFEGWQLASCNFEPYSLIEAKSVFADVSEPIPIEAPMDKQLEGFADALIKNILCLYLGVFRKS